MAVRPLLHQDKLFFISFNSKASFPSSLLVSSSSFPPNTKSLNVLSSSYCSSSFPSQPSPPPCIHLHRVSTAPVEYAPAPEFNFHQEIARLKALRSKLSNLNSLPEKIKALGTDSRVRYFFNASENRFVKLLEGLGFDEYQVYLLNCLVAAGQQHVLGGAFEESSSESLLKSALYALAEMIEKWDGNLASEGLGYGEDDIKALRSLLKTLGEVEQFYDCIGGIIGSVLLLLNFDFFFSSML